MVTAIYYLERMALHKVGGFTPNDFDHTMVLNQLSNTNYALFLKGKSSSCTFQSLQLSIMTIMQDYVTYSMRIRELSVLTKSFFFTWDLT